MRGELQAFIENKMSPYLRGATTQRCYGFDPAINALWRTQSCRVHNRVNASYTLKSAVRSQECERGTHEYAMPLSFLTSGTGPIVGQGHALPLEF
jgi:hypothetical protein